MRYRHVEAERSKGYMRYTWFLTIGVLLVLKYEIFKEETDSPSRSSHCRRCFSPRHWLPQNHQYLNLHAELPLDKEQKATPEPQKPKQRTTTLVTASIILIILASAFIALSYKGGYEKGYTQGIADGAGRSYSVRDPTYQEAMQFVASDQTDKNTYNETTYTCYDYSADFKNNAFKARFRCAYVYVQLREGAHAIVAFNTTNHGIVFIEPQDDEIVTLTVGQPYWNRAKYSAPTYDDAIVRFELIW